MTTLFIDTTYDISIGVLGQNDLWLDFQIFKGQKVSNVLQKEIYNILKKHDLKLNTFTNVISVAGPGFYTGLRLSEGFADVLKLSGIQHFSFLSYHIPRLVGIEEGAWITKAYRGEYLIHKWGLDKSSDILISEHELNSHLSNLKNIFIHSESAVDDKIMNSIQNYQTTQNLIQKYPENIFKHLNYQTSSYYFRAPEDEFKVSVK